MHALFHHHHHHLTRIRPLGLFRFRIYFSEAYESIGQLVGLIGRMIGPTQGLYLHTGQHNTKKDIHASSGIRTHDTTVRAAKYSTCLRPLSHWDRHALFLVGKPEGRRPLGRPRYRWKNNIRMYSREIGWKGVDWMHLARNIDQ
jgi:hypothetical protein